MVETNITEKKEPSTLSKSLNIGMDSMPSIGQTKEGREYATTAKPLMENLAKSIADVEIAKMDVETQKIGAKAKASQEFGETTRKLNQEEENELLNYPRSEFHPTKENAESLGQLFSMVATFGLMLGNSGKLASQNALGAMTGMLKGWQSGRKDLYERELKEFDKEYKRMQDLRTDIQNKIQKRMQLASTDKETSQLLKEEAIAQLGSNSVGGKLLAQGKDKAAYDLLTNTTNIDEKVKDRQQAAYLAQQKMQQSAEQFRLTQLDKGNKKASDRFGFGDIVAAASNESAAAIKNIMTLPFTSSSGLFGGRTTTSMITAPLDAMTNTLTSETVQRYNVEFGKLGYSLAQLMSGGRAVRVSDVGQMNNLLQIKEGDTLETAATKIAEARQLAERTIQVRSKSSSTDPGLKEVFKENLETIETVVPFTVADINEFVNKRDRKTTFGQSLSDRYKDKSLEKIAAPEGYEELK